MSCGVGIADDEWEESRALGKGGWTEDTEVWDYKS